jgi:hypothetical protein
LRVINAGRIAILSFLLSEADFFVDGKDLQTLSARLPGRAFFCSIESGVVVREKVAVRRRRPVLHHGVRCIHGRREEVLPVIALPGGILIKRRTDLSRLCDRGRGKRSQPLRESTQLNIVGRLRYIQPVSQFHVA